MIKLFIAIFFTLLLLKADILDIHKKIVPISLLQVKHIINKTDKNINIAIVVNKKEELYALTLKELFPKSVKKYKLNVDIIHEKELYKRLLFKDKNYDALYLFSLKHSTFDKLINYSILKNTITFSNNYLGLTFGALIYVEFTNKIKIYLNKTTMKDMNIILNNRFLNMVKLYEK